MDEYTWVWLYQSWLQDREDLHKTYKDYALFLGAFTNPEMARNIMKDDEPDYEASEEDFEKSTEIMVQQRNADLNKIHHRRRRKVVTNPKD